MFPYWILGALVIGAVIAAGEKRLLRIERRPVIDWILFLIMVTVIRFVILKVLGIGILPGKNPNIILLPWAVSLTVYWEDACHSLPLEILRKLIGESIPSLFIHIPALVATMISFGAGHLYQGVAAAVLLSLYIPYSRQAGRKYGFGTVIVCHMLYDLVTILFVRSMLG